jgi:hypothetical protein
VTGSPAPEARAVGYKSVGECLITGQIDFFRLKYLHKTRPFAFAALLPFSFKFPPKAKRSPLIMPG